MSLKDKASRLKFGDLDAPAPAAVPGQEERPASRPRSGVAAITQSIGVHHRVLELEATLADYEKAGTIVLLDPKRIGQTKWRNRDVRSYSTAEYKNLKNEIEAAGRNVQPIKVRRIGDGPDGKGAFEVVYGRRRLRACLELGLPVAAIVQQLSDVEVFQEMERENRQRADLTAWEQGTMYKDAIDQGLFASQRQMATALGVDPGNLSKAIKLASLPSEIIDAFASPLDLQFRWSSDLTEAFERDPAKVLVAAEAARQANPRPAAKDVYSRLIGATESAGEEPAVREFVTGKKRVATWSKQARGDIALKIKRGALSPAKERKLLETLERLLSDAAE